MLSSVRGHRAERHPAMEPSQRHRLQIGIVAGVLSIVLALALAVLAYQ